MKNVLGKVKEAKYYAVLGDETTDASGTEHLSVCIRYLEIQKSTIHEKFICLLSATNLTDAALSDQIVQELNRVGLQVENLTGQGYGGGANMSGIQSRVKQPQPLETYMHCAAHKLNQAIVKALACLAVALDLNLCYEMVDSVIRTLERYRETEYEEIFQEACRIVEPLDIPVQAPRTAKCSTYRSNIEAPDAKEFYRLNVFLPFIDFVLGQLRSRFSKAEHSSIFDLFTLIPSAIVKTQNLTSRNNSLEEALERQGTSPQTAAGAHQETNRFFPNIKILLQILATLPVSTCSVERSFSSLKLIKSYLRTTMTKDRLNGLAAMYIHRDISGSLQPVDVIEEFAKSYPRRLPMR
ncbi:hypothetical protein ILUMI_08935 [Ignelater luminosus]|uniref:HAT C-terminal dimerisation domain-containing protein n=1 Tax=Ignelater luminosus TaxID=2038154 RepID=A0A8K0D584_IGNLU|nr:hypothetical protein ILUMI_08935 [Ignelater luminosus]